MENMHLLMLKEMSFETLPITDPSNSTISSKVLYEAINTTIFASGNDDLRPVMSEFFFNSLIKT